VNRRHFIFTLTGGAIATAAGVAGWRATSDSAANAKTFEVTLSESEWRERLNEDEFYILREAGTEPAYTSELLGEKRTGTYYCAGCDNALYASKTKFDSGTGWPSFYEALPGAVGTKADYSLMIPRTEVHCARCGGHLGHIFDDGPPPTGNRHCINGLALDFKPATG
jgi:peptide-methionine (R)-S-oxide reductase